MRAPPIRFLLALACVATACRSSEKSAAERPAAPPAVASPASHASSAPSAVHDPAHPPIDCPLRKQGIDPTRMRPFEDVDKYIAFLERLDRAAWQKPDQVVAALGLEGKETVFDLGAASGYFTFRIARALASGRVVAADTEAEMIRHIHHRAMSEGIRNIGVKIIQPNDPGVPAEADLVFICDVLHHVVDRSAWLARLAGEMKPAARLALIELKEGPLPEGPPEAAKIPRAKLVELVTRAGLVLDSERKDLLPYQVFLVFKKP
jgi:SAM-dependent methyltransferase